MEKEINNEKGKNVVIGIFIGTIVCLCIVLVVLFATGIISLSNNKGDKKNQNNNTNNYENANTKSLSAVCTAKTYDKLEILSMENKSEKIGPIGGGSIGYNVTTTVTREHNYTSTPETDELYTNDMNGTLFFLYKNKLYYTSQKETISKYCSSNGEFPWKRTCDYSKLNDNIIKEFNTISIDLNLKAIGTYGTSGSGAPTPYAITTDGKIINLPDVLSNNYSNCGILYDNSEYPIDRIFNLYFHDGIEYTILLKNGTLITRDIDREHPIELEH